MADLRPIYTQANCSFCCPLTWGVSIFWRAPMQDTSWLEGLTEALAPDGVRVLRYRFSQPGVSQFAVSTQAPVAPKEIVQRLKGRLQYSIRTVRPKALKRNFAIRSFGRVTRNVVDNYVASQLTHHPVADARFKQILHRFQIHRNEVDLSEPRRTSQGIYWYNLHVVLVHRERWSEFREEVFHELREMILRICATKEYLLARATIL